MQEKHNESGMEADLVLELWHGVEAHPDRTHKDQADREQGQHLQQQRYKDFFTCNIRRIKMLECVNV